MSLKKISVVLFCFCGLLYSCEKSGKSVNEITVLENLLIEKTTEINTLSENASKGLTVDNKLIHTVFFNLKDDLTKDEFKEFKQAIESLSGINGVEKLIYGNYLDVGDTRSMKEMEVVIQIVFKDTEQLKNYQEDKTHLNAKKRIGPLLECAPLTYDYIVLN